jgi:UDP-N-acetylmuramate: L-alanyl-gamma-D-glutamyl-meso-diaminopimelate ligase
LPSSLHKGTGPFCVVEGDEYDDVFFSKKAKFLHYQPKTCIINAIEFDHADLYADVEVIANTFTEMLNTMPADGIAICCIDFPEVAKRMASWRQTAKCKFITFGESKDADFKIIAQSAKGFAQTVEVLGPSSDSITLKLQVPGVFNGRNALATYIACAENGLDKSEVIKALAGYSSVKRRQQVRYEDNSLLLIEDFAHHPTAVNETLKAIRAGYPDRKIRAIFEPRSNTSRRMVFKDAYIAAFSSADQCILCEVSARSIDVGQSLLDVSELANEITTSGVECLAMPDAKTIAEHIFETKNDGDIFVVMSNGSFGGLIDLLVEGLGA